MLAGYWAIDGRDANKDDRGTAYKVLYSVNQLAESHGLCG